MALRSRCVSRSFVLLGALATTGCGNDDATATNVDQADAAVLDRGSTDATEEALADGSGGTASDAAADAQDDVQDDAHGDGGTVMPTSDFVIGLWCGIPPAELSQDRMDEVAEAGFTLVTNACDMSALDPSYNKQMLAFAASSGIGVFVVDPRLLDAVAGNNIDANLDAVVADYAGAPALWAYVITDEPNASMFPRLATIISGLSARDPAHFGLINLFPDYATAAQLGTATYDDYVASFLATVNPQVFTYDHYNFLSDGTDGPTFFTNLAVIRAHSVLTGKPFGQFIQSISYNGHRTPSGPEKRWAALSTLAYGGRGVFYFTYWTPVGSPENFGDGIISSSGARTPQYDEVQSINASLDVIGRYLAAARSEKVFHNGALPDGTAPRAPGDWVYVPSPAPMIVGLFSVGNDAYALLVNGKHDATTESDVIFASATGAIDVLDVATRTFVPAPNATPEAQGVRMHVSLPPGDGLLVHLPGPVPAGPQGAEGFFGTVRNDAGWLDVVDSSFGTQRLHVAGWHYCPEGTTEAGQDFQSNGFWFCARSDLVSRTFYVGNVVSDAGILYKLQGGQTTLVGAASWDTCPAGTLLGHRLASDGFWVCME
jgi:hypothetical protein